MHHYIFFKVIFFIKERVGSVDSENKRHLFIESRIKETYLKESTTF